MTLQLAHRADPTTPHNAARHISGAAQIKAALMELLTEEPRAAFQLTDAYFNLRYTNGWPACKPDGIAKRLSELHKVDRLIVESGRTVLTPYGRAATVWMPTPKPEAPVTAASLLGVLKGKGDMTVAEFMDFHRGPRL